MKPDAPVDDAAMTERINTNTPIQMNAIKRVLEAEAAALPPPGPGTPASEAP